MAGEHQQQIEIILVEFVATELVDAGDTPEEPLLADQRHENDTAGIFLPPVAFIIVQQIQRTAPPGSLVAQDPSAQADADGQFRIEQLLRILSGCCTVDIV